MSFEIGELVILNEKVMSGLPNNLGEVVTIHNLRISPNYQFTIELDNGVLCPVRESELNKLTEEQKQLVTYIKKDNQVLYTPTNEKVTIQKVDLLYAQIEIKHADGGVQYVGVEALRKLDSVEVGSVFEGANSD